VKITVENKQTFRKNSVKSVISNRRLDDADNKTNEVIIVLLHKEKLKSHPVFHSKTCQPILEIKLY